jgi:pimeloyl-ACP methyl ester carboxylesterase
VAGGEAKAINARSQVTDVSLVAENVTGGTLAACGHFLPEERPAEIAQQIIDVANAKEPQ